MVYWKGIEVYIDDYKFNKHVFSQGICCMNKGILCIMLLGITFVRVL